MDRGYDLTQQDYDNFINKSASEYFHRCWNNKLQIVDRYNKGVAPAFLNQGLWIDILIDDQGQDIYKFLASRKLWLWNDSQKLIISQLDHPDWIMSKYKHNKNELAGRINYNNQYKLSGYTSFDDFFERYLKFQNFITPYMTNSKINNGLEITISELVNFDAFSESFVNIEKHFDQKINRDQLKKYHLLWTQRSGLI
jgi:hypothetical protein